MIAGNPPHVNWEHLAPEWRVVAEKAYRRYGLFSLSGFAGRHGGGKKDIAALFTYATVDHFLKPNGVFALVLHTSLVKTSGAGDGFRGFVIPRTSTNQEDVCLSIECAHDFASFQPFRTHPGMRIKTRTMTIAGIKGKEIKYPVTYVRWTKNRRGNIPNAYTWREAQSWLTRQSLLAVPLRGEKAAKRSPWLTMPKARLPQAARVIAPIAYEPEYKAREGVNSGGLNGAYFVRVLGHNPDGTARIENLHDAGKIRCKKVRAVVEHELLYPLVRGRDIAPWRAQAGCHILMLQDPNTRKGIATTTLQAKYPLAWRYIRKFEKQLRARKAFQKFYNPEVDAFYSMYSVTTDTFAPFKLVWMDICNTIKACVLHEVDGRQVLPEHTAMFVALQRAEEAHYLAAVVNSPPFREVVEGYIVDNHVSTHPLENIVVPRFDAASDLHGELAQLSIEAQDAALTQGEMALPPIESKVADLAQELWP